MAPITPLLPSRGTWAPIGTNGVTITGGCWADWQNATTAMIDHADRWMTKLGWVDNFSAAATGTVADRRGREFSDSDVYKLMEAMAWQIARTGDARLSARLSELTDLVAAAQSDDGYVSTMFGRPGQRPHYVDLQWGHELYCMGHLIQAGVARARTAGLNDPLVTVARRAADHICATFNETGNQGICGHPEIETALVELYRVTGDQAYLDQARQFINRRGHGVLGESSQGAAYWQDDVPVRDATALRGHAVRAMYLMAGAIDVAVEDGDDALLAAVERQVLATFARRTHLTGGMGSRHDGEAFGDDWELPPDRAYCETCAGVAAVMACQRLLLATGKIEYADMAERILYNVVATSPNLNGRGFFYANPLQRRVPGKTADLERVSLRADTGQRAAWFDCSCCPTNVARLFASLGAYLATRNDIGVQIHQYAPSTIRADLPQGTVELAVSTHYPLPGRTSVTVMKTPETAWALTLRIPGWSRESWLQDDKWRVLVGHDYATFTKKFKVGDIISLDLDDRPHWTRPDPRIDAVRGQIAVERGPLVLALESLDTDLDLDEVAVDTGTPPEFRDGRVWVRLVRTSVPDPDWPYAAGFDPAVAPLSEPVPLVEYRNWARRGPSAMRVWLPVA